MNDSQLEKYFNEAASINTHRTAVVVPPGPADGLGASRKFGPRLLLVPGDAAVTYSQRWQDFLASPGYIKAEKTLRMVLLFKKIMIILTAIVFGVFLMPSTVGLDRVIWAIALAILCLVFVGADRASSSYRRQRRADVDELTSDYWIVQDKEITRSTGFARQLAEQITPELRDNLLAARAKDQGLAWEALAEFSNRLRIELNAIAAAHPTEEQAARAAEIERILAPKSSEL